MKSTLNLLNAGLIAVLLAAAISVNADSGDAASSVTVHAP